MTDKMEISMRKCPACNEDWIQDDAELVCPKCIPIVYADTIVYEVHRSIQDADKLPVEDLRNRLPILRRAKQHLDAILESLEKEPQ